jgi:hypothetical protein
MLLALDLELSLFPDLDGLDGLISDSIPWLQLWAVVLVAALFLIMVRAGLAHLRRSPVEKILRRRFG